MVNRQKRVRTDLDEVELNVPRDQNGDFEPEIVPNHKNDISPIEGKVISIYAKRYVAKRYLKPHRGDLRYAFIRIIDKYRKGTKGKPIFRRILYL